MSEVYPSRLTLIGPGTKKYHGLYQCSCGNTKEISSYAARNTTKSCGCLAKELLVVRNKTELWGTTHDKTDTTEHSAWAAMKARCYNSKRPDYMNYGGRGITVCERWLGDDGFESFLADMGECPINHSIDRINNDGNYEPSNCRWATKRAQNQNKRSNHNLTLDGVTLCLTEWARRLGITHKSLAGRLTRGWSLRDALTTPKIVA